MANIFKLIVELYELLITARKDDRSGRVISTGSLKIDDLTAIAASRRTDINPVTLKAAYEILKETALDEICNGKQVEFGLSHYRVGVSGVFIGDHATWDDNEHSLYLQATTTLEARNALKEISVEVRGMAQSGIFINSITDVTSGEVNSKITPGGGVNICGSKIRVTGDASGVGLFLTDINTNAVTAIPTTSILTNDPSKITLIVPASLPHGDYRLSIVTQYSVGTLLKEPRTYVFDTILVAG